jgi:DNA-binding NarL/FixJ family response regulator
VIRIIVADHNVRTLQALNTMLQEQQGMEMVGLADHAEELLTIATSHCADVILVDRKLPGIPLSDLLAALHALSPRPYVIVMGSNIQHGRSALSAGADAFVSKSDDPEWLLESITGYSGRTQ